MQSEFERKSSSLSVFCVSIVVTHLGTSEVIGSHTVSGTCEAPSWVFVHLRTALCSGGYPHLTGQETGSGKVSNLVDVI